VLEQLRPQRDHLLKRGARWSGNLGVFLVDVLLIGIPLNGLVFGALVWADTRQVGLMDQLDLPFEVKAVIGFLALDALFYVQHRVSHAVPMLWRLHRVHHADTGMDVSTANRVHPLETLWLTFLRVSLAVLLGIPIVAFVAFLLTLNILSVFNHANIRLPGALERGLRMLFVTPGFHETHHSAHASDYDTNFAFIFSFWDRLFGTYKAVTTPVDGRVSLGLDEFRGAEETGVLRLLTMPFRDSVSKSG
jgi:sterol desaturase/sphingolipid hydroxylase (fatty acid hydroxylase superfamily)